MSVSVEQGDVEQWPGYRTLLASGELTERVRKLEALLAPCRVCPRRCGVDRLTGRIGACFGGQLPAVSSFGPHLGEEPPISGRHGSGTIFFTHCNLRCVYCQNHQISQRFDRRRPDEVSIERLAEMMLSLQRQGCHNINFVSPTHFAPQMARAIACAADHGLRLPIVYNTNAYDSIEVIRLLDGIVDLYMPDLKYGDGEAGRRLSRVRDYPDHARAAIAEMWRQVGPLQTDREGVGRRGLLVRHLVLPGDLAGSESGLRWLRETCGPEPTVGIMAQYYPTHRSRRYPPLDRRIDRDEYDRVVQLALGLGFENLLVQDRQLAPDTYRPDFDRDRPFGDP